MYIKVLVDETKDESSDDVNIFKYSCQKKFLIFLWFVIVLLLNEKPFLATAFEFVYLLTTFYFRRDTSWAVEVADDFLLPTHFLCCFQPIYIIW